MLDGCNFDHGMCAWTNDKTDQFDWTLNKGSTNTTGTGPTSDHTQGNTKGMFWNFVHSVVTVIFLISTSDINLKTPLCYKYFSGFWLFF